MTVSLHNPDDATIAHILKTQKNIAIIGASAKPQRPVYTVMTYLLERGFTLYPVNPGLAGKQILGQVVYGALDEIPHSIDIVDIFRNSEAALSITQAALPLGPSTIWMQLGVINLDAAKLAKANGVEIIMDRCPKIEYARLIEA